MARGISHRLRARFPKGFFLWAGLTLLMAVGLLTSIADLAGVPATQTRRANETQQRVIIDPVTGLVSGLKDESAPTSEFEVAAPEEPAEAAPAPVTEAPAEPVAEEPAETPPAPPAVEKAPEPVVEAKPAAAASAIAETTSTESLRRAPVAATYPTAVRTNDSLVAAPAREITEKIEGLNVPVVGEKDARASALYARGFSRAAEQPIVAFVVTDAGFSAESMNMILSLPPEVTVGMSAYATDGEKQITVLRNRGHEVWAMLPTATARYPQDDPGPLGLIPALTKHETFKRMFTILDATIGSVGVILPSDEAISSQADLWSHVLGELTKRGLYILSTHPTRGIEQLTAELALQASIRRADTTLDSTPGTAFIRSKLASIKDNAVAQKKLVVLVSARPQALKILGQWLQEKTLADAATIAPLSAIYAPDAPPPAPEPEKKSSHGGGH